MPGIGYSSDIKCNIFHGLNPVVPQSAKEHLAYVASVPVKRKVSRILASRKLGREQNAGTLAMQAKVHVIANQELFSRLNNK